jgi:hypothetical protein
MHRIDHPTADKTDPAKPRFTEGNPLSGTPATQVTDDWLNSIQEEICAVLAAAGIAPVKANNAQLTAAIQAVANQRIGALVTSASYIAAGVVEIASHAEVVGFEDEERAVTPYGLSALTPSTVRMGFVELATVVEAVAGTDNIRAVTPAGVKAAVAASGGKLLGVVNIKASAAAWVPPAGTQSILWRLIAGGGAGGGGTAGATRPGAGGAGGSYAEVLETAIAASYAVTVGAGGAGVSGGIGGVGGDTTVTPAGGTTYTARGGYGGTENTALPPYVVQGGAVRATPGVNVDMAVSGAPGGAAFALADGIAMSGAGGGSIFGGQARGLNATSASNGDAGAANSGGGGGGGNGTTSAARAGGNGGSGMVQAWCFG